MVTGIVKVLLGECHRLQGRQHTSQKFKVILVHVLFVCTTNLCTLDPASCDIGILVEGLPASDQFRLVGSA
jgi:hypothetical protein